MNTTIKGSGVAVLIYSAYILSSPSAMAGVTFIKLGVDASGAAAVYNDLSANLPKTSSPSKTSSTGSLATAEGGIVAAVLGKTLSQGSSTDKKASTALSETTSALANSAGSVDISFSGATSATLGKKVGASAYANDEDDGSSSTYKFKTTTNDMELTINWDTFGSNTSSDAYVVELYNVTAANIVGQFDVASIDDGSMTFDLPKATWLVTITEASGTSAPDYVSAEIGATANGSSVGDFTLTVGVPEIPSWAMLGLGFGVLGFSWRRASRQSVSLSI